MSVGIVMPLFALGASALGIAAEWSGCGPVLKGVLGVAGGVGSNGLFDWLKSRWFTRSPGAEGLLENHHLAQMTGMALRRGFELAAAEAEIVDPEKRGVALHAPRLRKLAAAAGERWLSLVDDQQTPQFDPLRTTQLADVVTAVCRNEGATPVLDVADWEPLVRGVDSLEGGKSLSPAAVAHTARVLRERVARLFYELMKDARETTPEAFAALQLHFFADLKSAAAEQREDLRAVRAELETLTATLADGAGAEARKAKFNWARLTSMLRPMRDMTDEWRVFYARHDQRWDVLLARLDTLPDETAQRVWDRLPRWLRFAVPLLLAVAAGAGLAVWRMSRTLDEQSVQQAGTQDEIRKLRSTITQLSTVADQILGSRGALLQSGEGDRPGSGLADAAAARGQRPDELRSQLTETAAAAARLAAQSKGAEARELWRKAGDLAAAADEKAEAERHYRAAMALTEKGSAEWCELAADVAAMLGEQSRLGEDLELLAEIVKHREALADVAALASDLDRQRRALEAYGRYVESEEVARRVIALEPKFPKSPPEARADCLAALIGARTQFGEYAEIVRIGKEFGQLSFGDSDQGRVFSRQAMLATALQLITYGDQDGALDKLERATAMNVRSGGARRHFIQTAVGELTRLFPVLPYPPRVRRLLDDLLKQADALVAEDFSRFGTLLQTRGGVFAASGQFVEELTLMRDGLARARKTFPEGHTEIALWQSDVARMLTAPDEESEAEALWAQALPILEKRMGRQHGTTLNIKADRAHFFGSTGRVQRAEAEFREVLATLTRVLTPWHSRVISAKFDVLATLGAPERAAEARELREEIYTTLRDHPRPEHLAVLGLYSRYLGMRLTEAERTRFAADYEKIVAAVESRASPGSLMRLLVLTKFGEILDAAGQGTRAAALMPRILDSSAQLFGAESLMHAKMLVNGADSLRRRGDAAGAEALLRRAISVAEKSGSNAAIARQRRELALFLIGTSRAAEARQELETGTRLLEQRPDDDPALLFDTIGDLGAVLIGVDDAAAERLLRRSMDEEEKKFGFDVFAMEKRSANLAWLLHKTGRTKEGETVVMRVIRAPGNHPDGSPKLRIGPPFFTYATILIETGRAREAEIRLRRALAANSPWGRRAEDLYSRALRSLGWQDASIDARVDRVRRGEQVPDL